MTNLFLFLFFPKTGFLIVALAALELSVSGLKVKDPPASGKNGTIKKGLTWYMKYSL